MMSAGFAGSAGSRRPRVLVADDDDALRRCLARRLSVAGFDVAEAMDGLEASAALTREAFDAVVADLGMPNMGGAELLRIVRARDVDLPVLVLTGDTSIASAQSATRDGASGYLVKPFKMADLVEKLLSAISRRTRFGTPRGVSALGT